MSGGHFDHNQHQINYIKEELDEIINKDFKYETECNNKTYYDSHVESRYLDIFKKYYEIVSSNMQYVYDQIHNFDKFLCGDYSDDTLIERDNILEEYVKLNYIKNDIIKICKNISLQLHIKIFSGLKKDNDDLIIVSIYQDTNPDNYDAVEYEYMISNIKELIKKLESMLSKKYHTTDIKLDVNYIGNEKDKLNFLEIKIGEY